MTIHDCMCTHGCTHCMYTLHVHTWICKKMHDCEWLNMIMYGYEWMCMTRHDYACYDYTWIRRVMHDYVWICWIGYLWLGQSMHVYADLCLTMNECIHDSEWRFISQFGNIHWRLNCMLTMTAWLWISMFVVVWCHGNSISVIFWQRYNAEMRMRKPEPTLSPTQQIYSLPYHAGMIWEELAFNDTVSYTQRWNGLQHS